MKTLTGRTVGKPNYHYFYFNFSRFDNGNDNTIFIEAPIDFSKWEWPKDKKVIYLELEEPNRFFVNSWFRHLDVDEKFDRVIQICPYTYEFMKNKYPRQDRYFGFIPFDENLIPSVTGKKYDVVYFGHIFNSEIKSYIEAASKFKTRIISNTENPLVTNQGISHQEKLKIISETRITIVHNLLWLAPNHASQLNSMEDSKKNRAFDLLNTGLVPQIKGRVFEAAFCRSLILCRKDPFNVIEYFFEPEKEFVYFELDKLEETIKNVLENFDHYESVIENAYRRAVNEYTTRVFYDRFLRGE